MNSALILVGFTLVASAEDISYPRDVLPVLSGQCYQCHGPDESSREAGLRLDIREGAVALRDGVAAIVPGDANASELIKRITSDDPNYRMPPPEHGEALTPDAIDHIRAWIDSGAEWSSHWAFEPPAVSEIPNVKHTQWVTNPIDNFVLARLEREGLKPSRFANRETLIRRLSLDITGLPPSIELLDQVLADERQDWYARLVDRLLDSPHYGERWARLWLDAAQYADSDGFEKDKPRFVWAWRDWVINAFNDNMPYGQFITEQIAGDLLPNATQAQHVATGFLRNSMINEEGGIDPEQFRMEAMFNRMDLVGRAMLGLTVQCAQCHSHKYDPITQTDYYEMMAFLNNSHEACITVYSNDERDQISTIDDLIRDIQQDIKRDNPDWAQRVAAWENDARAIPKPKWEALSFEFDDSSAGGQKCIPQGDGSYLAQGYAPTRFHPKMVATTNLKTVTAVKLELLNDPNLPRSGPGRSIYGSSALAEFEFRTTESDLEIAKYGEWKKVEIASAIADVNPPVRVLGDEYPERDKPNDRTTGPVSMAIDGDMQTAWTTDIDPVHRNEPHYVIFTFKEPVAIQEGTRIAVRMSQVHGGYNSDDNQTNNIGRFRISVTDSTDLPKQAIPPRVQRVIDTPPGARSAEDNDILFAYWIETVRELTNEKDRIASLRRAYPDGTTQLVLQERAEPRETHRLVRGDFLSPAEPVDPGVPGFMHALNVQEEPGRLAFARWIASENSPTTARAYVNRVWQAYFGEGIVSTPSDLGLQGAQPSHPELLNWLAVSFMESGWDVKQLHRTIVSSSTYRQRSNYSPDLLERDPDNRLLARASRVRVQGEIVRDIALAASGRLHPAVGGPSVYPPAPDFLFLPPASYGPKVWRTDDGPDRYRRGIYTFRFRSVPYPALQVFDVPPGDAPCTRRARSNTPLQALTALNEPLFFECAGGLAEEMIAYEANDDASRLAYAFRRCTSRKPDATELKTLTNYLNEQRQRIDAGEIDPAAILNNARIQSQAPDRRNELAAWTLAARVILNLDETIVRP